MALTQSFAIAPPYGLGSPPIMWGVEGTTQTWKAGEPLVASSGVLNVATADPTAETLVGLSVADSTAVTGTACAFIPFLPNLVFEGQIQNAAGDATIAQATHMYAEFGINVTSNKWWIDTDETTHKDVIIVGFKDPVGTLNGVVYFQFKPGATIYAQAVT